MNVADVTDLLDPDLPIPMIATRDVAGEAAARLLRRDVTGHQVKLLLGPEDVTMAAATRAIGEREVGLGISFSDEGYAGVKTAYGQRLKLSPPTRTATTRPTCST